MCWNLFNDASIARFLASDETLFYSEFPFLWRRNDRSVLEGLIDSIMINGKAGRRLLLDWKTNDVSSSETETFRTHYRPQLAAYTGKWSRQLPVSRWKLACFRPPWDVCCLTLRMNCKANGAVWNNFRPDDSRTRFDRTRPMTFNGSTKATRQRCAGGWLRVRTG